MTDRHLVIGAAALTVLLVAASALIATPAGGAAAPSSYSAAAAGGKAAFETLRALGHQVERSYEPVASLRVEPSRTTLLITGLLEPSEGDREALRRFVEGGGDVLLVGQHGADFLRLEAAPAPPIVPGPVRHRPLAASPLVAGVTEITMRGDAGVPSFGHDYARIFAAGDRPLVVTRLQQGRITWWASPTPLANRDIAAADNLPLLLNVVGTPGARRILWDEHYHGTSRSLWSYLAATPLPWMGAQIALIAAAAVMAFSRRSGPVRSRATEPRTSPLEFIDMLGEMYKRAGARTAAVSAARARLVRTAIASGSVPAGSSDHLVARVIATKTDGDASEIESLLTEARHAAGDATISGEAAVALITRLQLLSSRLQGTAPRRA